MSVFWQLTRVAILAALLVVDAEDEFFPQEIQKLYSDVTDRGLNLIVFGDWYNGSVLNKIRFYDENTNRWWHPETGGANLAALNDLLQLWNISLTGTVLEGDFVLANHKMHYASGSSILPLSKDVQIVVQTLKNQGDDVVSGGKEGRVQSDAVVLALLNGRNGSGTVAVYGDSNCLDSAHLQKDCYWLAESLLDYTADGHMPTGLGRAFVFPTEHKLASMALNHRAPARQSGTNFAKYSRVVNEISKSLQLKYRPLPTCKKLKWNKGVLIENTTMPYSFRQQYRLLAVKEDMLDQEELIRTKQEWPSINQIVINRAEESRLVQKAQSLTDKLSYYWAVIQPTVSSVWFWLILIALLCLSRKMRWRRVRRFFR